MEFNDIVRLCHARSVENGWWVMKDCDACDGTGNMGHHLPCTRCDGSGVIADTATRNQAEVLALIHSEISEALDGIRVKGHDLSSAWYTKDEHGVPKPDGPRFELIDAVIRIFDALGAWGVPNAQADLIEKLDYNRTRGQRHGGKVI